MMSGISSAFIFRFYNSDVFKSVWRRVRTVPPGKYRPSRRGGLNLNPSKYIWCEYTIYTRKCTPQSRSTTTRLPQLSRSYDRNKIRRYHQIEFLRFLNCDREAYRPRTASSRLVVHRRGTDQMRRGRLEVGDSVVLDRLKKKILAFPRNAARQARTGDQGPGRDPLWQCGSCAVVANVRIRR
jgi:hypothetical protein